MTFLYRRYPWCGVVFLFILTVLVFVLLWPPRIREINASVVRKVLLDELDGCLDGIIELRLDFVKHGMSVAALIDLAVNFW